LAKIGRQIRDPASDVALLVATVDELQRRIAELEGRQAAARAEIDAMSRERDRYRSDAGALRDVVAQLNTATQEAEAAFRGGLSKLENGKSHALSVLAAPASPEELLT
jgi:chromosome segregation ATPase